MSDQNSEPVGVTCLKLSDVTAAKQQAVTAGGIILASTGLTAAAAGTVGALLPQLGEIAPEAKPALVYVAAIALPLAGFWSLKVVTFGKQFRSALLSRLTAKQATFDLISDELYEAFTREIQLDHRLLARAQYCLSFGVFAPLVHAVSVIVLGIIPKFVPPEYVIPALRDKQG